MDAEKHFSVQERTQILELYFATKSVVLVQRQFRRDAPYSPDPPPPDYFWGYLKERLYQENP